MFTGIIESIGVIKDVQNTGDDQRFRISVGKKINTGLSIGDSIAVNGVCLTIVNLDGEMIEVDVSGETLSCTAFGQYRKGQKVNLERALALSDRLDGHLVSGHVDSTAIVKATYTEGRSTGMVFSIAPELMRYIVHKGSICIDGTSLTVNTVNSGTFSVNVIPHTLEHTIMSQYSTGTRVNIEVDLVARYIEKLLPVKN